MRQGRDGTIWEHGMAEGRSPEAGSDVAAEAGGRGGAAGAAQPLTVGLVQINNSFSGQNYLPYSVALLATYVEHKAADPARYRFLLPIYRRERIADVVVQLREADLVGFSTYVWNGRISL